MKHCLFLFTLLISSSGFTQVNFEVSDIIRESYMPSTPPGEYPLLIESSDGGLHLVKVGYTKKVVITDLDKDLHVLGIRTYKIPKGFKIRELFNVDQVPFFLFKTKSGSQQIMRLDLETGEFILQFEYTFPESMEKDLNKADLIYSENDGIGFHFSRHRMSQILDSVTTSHVVMFNRSLDGVIWETSIQKPELIRIKKGPRKDRKREGVMVMSIDFQDINTMTVHFDIGHVFSTKENTYFKYKGNITRLYTIENKKANDIWSKRIEGDHIPSNYGIRVFNADSISETDPIPFLNSKGEVETFSLELETVDGKMNLIRRNVNGEKLESLVVMDNISSFMKESSSQIYGKVLRDPSNAEAFIFHFQDESFFSPNPQYSVLSFRKKGDEIDQIIYQDDVYWKKSGSKLLEANELNYFENGEKYGAKMSEKLDRYVDIKISHTDSYKAHFLVNGKVYTLFTAYLIGNMTTQIVRWDFNN